MPAAGWDSFSTAPSQIAHGELDSADSSSSRGANPSGRPAAMPPPGFWQQNGKLIAIYLVLGSLVWAVFGGTVGHQFVDYDDETYVYENPRITSGLTIGGVISAFTQPHAQNWHPLTTISHMLDCQWFGLNPAGHHLTNVLLHAMATLLLFSVLKAMTGATWRSAFVAAVFAIHPLRAESVAWIAERKDVLSGVFFMLTLGAYVGYARDQRLSRYLLTASLFACALMSKPMVVTLPLLLLLLDYWPLGRARVESVPRPNKNRSLIAHVFDRLRSRMFIEKLPLLFLSFGSGVATVLAQHHTVGYGQTLPLTGRVSNALLSYVEYIGQMFWPANLAAFYPDAADRASILTIASCALLLIAITAAVFRFRNNRPYLLVGWCWYLVGLLPVIGIVQVGLQGRADRYTYLPQIGLYISAVWAVAERPVLTSRSWQRLLAGAATGIVALLGWRAAIQVSVWKNTESLWTHALAVTENNDVAHNNIAALLIERGRLDEAITHYEAALRAGAKNETHNHLSPAIVENSLGNVLAQKGDLNAAMVHYRHAVALRPDFPDARSNLSAMLFRTGNLAEAISEYQSVVASPPEDAVSHQKLAGMLVKANRPREAIAHYRRAVELAPDSLDALNALAWMLATSPDPAVKNATEALYLAGHADQLTHGMDPMVLRILAASRAACGRSAEAAETAQHALSVTRQNPALRRELEGEIKIYRDAASHIAAAGRD